MNVGAAKPEQRGLYYAWGETTTKSSYAASNYAYGTTAIGNGGNIQGTAYDAAYATMGTAWSMPTYEQLKELRDNCNWTWGTLDDVNGYFVTSKKEGYTDRTIFLPAAGLMTGGNLLRLNVYGSYYTSTINTGRPDFVYTLGWNETSNLSIYSDYSWSPFGENNTYAAQRYYGRTVRAVAVQKVTRP
jgi:hypothetical protein